MSLEASHIRFAYALKDAYQAKDLHAFISGSIYPDSRYYTHTPRVKTHPAEYSAWTIDTLTDFQKGWHSHLLCDEVQTEISKRYTPFVFEQNAEFGNEAWMQRIAIKIIQDIHDLESFDIHPLLNFLDYTECPNGEPPTSIASYNRFYADIYLEPIKQHLEHLDQIAAFMCIPDETIHPLHTMIETFLQRDDIHSYIDHVFDESIKIAKSIIGSHRQS